MFWDSFESSLLRPLCSPNNAVYIRCLWALYQRMVENWFDKDDWTPKNCRAILHKCLLEMKQTVHWEDELDAEDQHLLNGIHDLDDASRVYRYLKSVGWIREIEETGYQRVVYMPKQASSLLAALDDIARPRKTHIGARCQNVYLALQQATQDPVNNGTQVAVAAEHAREFCTQLSTMAASCRELAHSILEETATSQVLARFFNEFINGSLLEDYSFLKKRNHPYRYRAATLELVNATLADSAMIDALCDGQMQLQIDQTGGGEQIRTRIFEDLRDIYRCFQRIDEIMQKIEHYRCWMTRRTREALQYAMSTPVGLSANLAEVIAGLAQSPQALQDLLSISVPLYRDHLLGASRARRPRRRHELSTVVVPIEQTVIPEAHIKHNRAMDAYYFRRSENGQRLEQFIETQLQGKAQVSTDNINIGSLDDFIGYLQLRDLLNDAVVPSSPFYYLLEHYEVRLGEGMTSNPYVTAPQLIITRRSKVESSLFVDEEIPC